MQYDYIIVGGGSAGCVLANRLSARSSNQVLLCEAGPDTPHGKIPEEVLDTYPGTAYLDKRFFWNDLKATVGIVSHNNPNEDRPPLRKYEQARVLGGGSTINGQMANRGAPTDFEEWVSRGAANWNWDAVLPYYKKVERDMDFDGPFHGNEGHIPVRRIMPDLWNGHATAVGEAFAQAGFKYLPDQNGHFEDGYFPVAISNAYERRVSAATGYLGPGTRLRKNLTISTLTQVKELLFEGDKCIGVKAMVEGQEQTFLGKEIILSSGAIHSPVHLLRAGIGPALDLSSLGINVRANVPGVGQGLMDHPSVSVSSFIKPHARINAYSRRHLMVAMRYSSMLAGAPKSDMFVAAASKSAWHPVGEQIASMVISVYKTYSESGQVKLATKDWQDEPIVEFNLLSDPRDLDRLKDGVRRMAALHSMAALQAATTDPFPASYSDKVRQIGEINSKNRFITGVMAKLLDGPDILRRFLMEKLILEDFSLAQILGDNEAMEAFIKRAAIGVWHASSSCRMGAEDDSKAVTDNVGRVRGVAGLRICDASIFPVVPCANTNFPVFMAAEKIADAILDEA